MGIKQKTHSGAKRRFKLSKNGKGNKITKQASMHNHRMDGKSKRTRSRSQDDRSSLNKSDYNRVKRMLGLA